MDFSTVKAPVSENLSRTRSTNLVWWGLTLIVDCGVYSNPVFVTLMVKAFSRFKERRISLSLDRTNFKKSCQFIINISINQERRFNG